MLDHESTIVSPSRTYVAMCNKTNFDGHYFQKFTLPENTDANRVRIWGEGVLTHPEGHTCQIENNAGFASWFFGQEIDRTSCWAGAIAFEDFSDVKEVKAWWEEVTEVSETQEVTC